MSILAVEDLGIGFGGVIAVDGVSLRSRAGRDFRHDRPERRRQDHAVQHDLAVFTRRAAGASCLPTRTSPVLPPHELARRGLSRTFQNLQIFFRMTRNRKCDGRTSSAREAATCWRICSRLPSVASTEPRHARQGGGAAGPGRTCRCRRPTAGSLPYGALKRLEIARALATEPKVLLLDEPAAGCNPVETEEIDAVIQTIAAQGITVVLVEHDMRLVMKISNRIHVLDQGRTLAEGTAAGGARQPGGDRGLSRRHEPAGGGACSTLTTSPAATAASRCCTVFRWRFRPARSSRWSAATAPARRTLLRAISGVQPISGGSIRFADQAIDRLRAHRPRRARHRAGAGRTPGLRAAVGGGQSAARRLYARATETSAPIWMRSMPPFPCSPNERDTAAGALSGGQQQMLAIGRALMARPKLAAARRALDGACAGAGRTDLLDHRRAEERAASPCCWSSRMPMRRLRSPTAAM